MLQQTPVARVLPVYTQWMERWPTPADLAAATPAEIIRAWGRLGYPRRALRLHAAAAAIVADYAGQVPSQVEELLQLPGVGDYTARAVAAFAFGQRVPVVDTNVRRVLSRAVRGVDEHLPATAADRREMAALLPEQPAVAARFSAGVMELGALVCTARSPECDTCPLADMCRWRAAGYPAFAGPRRPAQAWHGTDRQVRGRILAALRSASGPLPLSELRTLSQGSKDSYDVSQWERCLTSLIADGLAAADHNTGQVSLPH